MNDDEANYYPACLLCGAVLVPLAWLGNEVMAADFARQDGERVLAREEHGWVSADWAIKTRPALRDYVEQVVRKVRAGEYRSVANFRRVNR
jgi:hypothetical protein